jgi:hypothetical protein
VLAGLSVALADTPREVALLLGLEERRFVDFEEIGLQAAFGRNGGLQGLDAGLGGAGERAQRSTPLSAVLELAWAIERRAPVAQKCPGSPESSRGPRFSKHSWLC